MIKQILVIDDEELVTKSLLKLLSSEGYAVTTARGGGEALEKVKEIDFNLIIVDIRMPRLDGIETIKLIRTYLDEANKKLIPEVVITAYADRDKYEEAKGCNVVDYLFKPFENAELLHAVRKVIGEVTQEK
jgi:CheY-like chemotaxis protein